MKHTDAGASDPEYVDTEQDPECVGAYFDPSLRSVVLFISASEGVGVRVF